jgi:hypothetical protein
MDYNTFKAMKKNTPQIGEGATCRIVIDFAVVVLEKFQEITAAGFR